LEVPVAKKGKVARSDGDGDGAGDGEVTREPYDPDRDIVVAEEPLTENYVARVMRYDGEYPGTPKLAVYRKGKKGKSYTPKRITEDVAVALAKAIPKLVKAGAFK
jgi:hypothetical protein